jgi:hypothetical protein
MNQDKYVDKHILYQTSDPYSGYDPRTVET